MARNLVVPGRIGMLIEHLHVEGVRRALPADEVQMDKPRDDADREILADGRGPYRRVGFRSLGELADELIRKLQAGMCANDNEPSKLLRAPARTREDD
ncbi:MAG TPA: hypothetical protein VGV37_06190 [Aliidongia sp.]|uniref:hypothetical protein n=1 Tax=Aliidongia sp. TaxID=1914230 RepID=UPI002DDD5B6B|nr:hypothetical protein [Aliidongia sp.]HEV2674114.1 hypothetical protein [Aliidongia sp.]